MLGRDCCAGPLAVAGLRRPWWKAGRPRDEGGGSGLRRTVPKTAVGRKGKEIPFHFQKTFS
jgi:hypothetical protein